MAKISAAKHSGYAIAAAALKKCNRIMEDIGNQYGEIIKERSGVSEMAYNLSVMWQLAKEIITKEIGGK